MKNIIDMLHKNNNIYSKKHIFREPNRDITYSDFVLESKAIGTTIYSHINSIHEPVVILIDKSIAALSSMIGTLYSGNYYTILDVKMPEDRMNLILDTLETKLLITDQKHYKLASELKFNGTIIQYEDICHNQIDEKILDNIYRKMIDTDPAYILFTSGSTGIPKGTVVSHRGVISYATWVCEAFNITDQTVFGNQTPFYFSMSVLDIFATMMSGATLYILPKMYFSFPAKLLNCLVENKINTIYWVPSALGIVANLKALDAILPTDIEKVLFAGEVMPTKILNYWRSKLPNAMYANLYGPTEVTDICTYYVVNREFSDDESLPIGNACNNCDVILLNEHDQEPAVGEPGELCVRGSFLANGYYKQKEKTAEAFVQNPLQKNYPEIIYRTGDIVKYNSYGELMYLSRKDFQIKHMGYRIELGEIETAIFAIDGVDSCACIYDDEHRWIVLFYQAKDLDNESILAQAKKKLPNYMIPNKMMKIKRMPHNANGKIDRKALKALYKEEN